MRRVARLLPLALAALLFTLEPPPPRAPTRQARPSAAHVAVPAMALDLLLPRPLTVRASRSEASRPVATPVEAFDRAERRPLRARPPTPRPATARRAPAARARVATSRDTRPVQEGAQGGAWACIRSRESGGDYRANTGNGYSGAYQFLASTWHSLGYAGLPYMAAPADQDEAARRLLARSGWGQWPQTSRACGLR